MALLRAASRSRMSGLLGRPPTTISAWRSIRRSSGGCNRRGDVPCPLTIYAGQVRVVRHGAKMLVTRARKRDLQELGMYLRRDQALVKVCACRESAHAPPHGARYTSRHPPVGSATPITVPTIAPNDENTAFPKSGNILPGPDFASTPAPTARPPPVPIASPMSVLRPRCPGRFRATRRMSCRESVSWLVVPLTVTRYPGNRTPNAPG